jgi:hypothetical protein
VKGSSAPPPTLPAGARAADPRPDVAEDFAAGGRLCAACNTPLANSQRPGARFHDGACRAAHSRTLRRNAILDRIAAAEIELTAIRSEVLRGALPKARP